MDIPAYGERNLARNQEENNKKFGQKRQKSEDCACPNRREKKEFEKVLKK